MQTNVHVFLFRRVGRPMFGAHVEADDDDRRLILIGLRRRSEQNVRFGNRADT